MSKEALAAALSRAREADENFTQHNGPSPLELWCEKYGVDIWKSKKKADDGEFTNGMYYPNEKNLRNPSEIKSWGNALHRDVLKTIKGRPDVSSEELFHLMQENHAELNKYFPFIYHIIAANPMRPSFYMSMFNDMCDAQIKIREGHNVDHIEAALEARFLRYKKMSTR